MKKILRKTAKIFNISGIILCILVSFIAVYIALCRINDKNASFFGYSIFKVVTSSMQPTISKGDYIIISEINCDSLRKGDIISFYSEESEIYGRINTHRIVDINSDGSFVTKGDAGKENDRISVRRENVIGKFVLRIHFPDFVNEKNILIISIILFIIITINEFTAIIKSKDGGEN